METFGQRLKALAEQRGMNNVQLGNALGITGGAVGNYLHDRRSPDMEMLVAISDIFGVSTDYLLTGSAASDARKLDEAALVRAQVAGTNGPELTEADFAMVRLNRAHLSAGPGHIPPEEHFYSALAFNRAWLKREGVNPEAASLVRVKGDSMEPTLRDGATVLVDHQRREPSVRKGIFALRIGEELFVKRLEKVGEVLMVSSDNTAHQSRALAGTQLSEVEVIGRVVWEGYTFRDA